MSLCLLPFPAEAGAVTRFATLAGAGAPPVGTVAGAVLAGAAIPLGLLARDALRLRRA